MKCKQGLQGFCLMAKGLRSKSQRKNKAAKRENIYEPVVKKRTERLAEKLCTSKSTTSDEVKFLLSDSHINNISTPADTSSSLMNESKMQTKGKANYHGRKKGLLPNPYGLSRREMSF